jgi:hypothetical protein
LKFWISLWYFICPSLVVLKDRTTALEQFKPAKNSWKNSMSSLKFFKNWKSKLKESCSNSQSAKNKSFQIFRGHSKFVSKYQTIHQGREQRPPHNFQPKKLYLPHSTLFGEQPVSWNFICFYTISLISERNPSFLGDLANNSVRKYGILCVNLILSTDLVTQVTCFTKIKAIHTAEPINFQSERFRLAILKFVINCGIVSHIFETIW